MSIEIWKKKAVSGIIKSRSGKIQKRGEIMLKLSKEEKEELKDLINDLDD